MGEPGLLAAASHAVAYGGSAFSRHETAECDVCYFYAGDIQNASYAIAIPDELGDAFRLASARAEAVGGPLVDGHQSRPSDLLAPRLAVLPMGWSWALDLCQLDVEEGVRRGGLPGDRLVSDRAAAMPLSLGSPLGAAYVDNFLVMGGPWHAVASTGDGRVDAGAVRGAGAGRRQPRGARVAQACLAPEGRPGRAPCQGAMQRGSHGDPDRPPDLGLTGAAAARDHAFLAEDALAAGAGAGVESESAAQDDAIGFAAGLLQAHA
eukprot:3056733-Pyramimonas_sp.AAC.1